MGDGTMPEKGQITLRTTATQYFQTKPSVQDLQKFIDNSTMPQDSQVDFRGFGKPSDGGSVILTQTKEIHYDQQ